MNAELKAAYIRADRVLLNCAEGGCPNEKQGEIGWPKRGTIYACLDCWNRHADRPAGGLSARCCRPSGPARCWSDK